MNFLRFWILMLALGLQTYLIADPIEPGPPSRTMLLPRNYVDSICTQLNRHFIAADSMIMFAEKAMRVSKLIGYQKGFAKSLILNGKAHALAQDLPASDSIMREALLLDDLDSMDIARIHFHLGRNSYFQKKMERGDSLMEISKIWSNNNKGMLFPIGMNMASRETMRKNFAGALERLAEIEPYLDEITTPEDSANFYHIQGASQINVGRVDLGKPKVLAALELYARAQDSLGQSKVYNTLVVLGMIQDDMEASLEAIQNSIDIYPSTGDSVFLAGFYRNEGIILRELGREAEALIAYWKAHDMMHQFGNVMGEIRAKISLGVMYKQMEQHQEAIACFREASEMPEIQSAPTTLATSKSNLASLFKETGNLDAALPLQKEAAALVEDHGSPMLRADVYNGLGAIQMELGQLEAARQSFQVVLAQGNGGDFGTIVSEAHLALGKLDLLENKPASALKHAQIAQESAGKSPSQLNAFNVKSFLAEAWFALGNTSRAISLGEAAWEMVTRMDLQKDQRELSEKLSRFYEKAGQTEKALAFSRIYQQLEAKRVATENEKAIHELQARMELDKKNGEIEVLSKENLLQTEKLYNRKLWIGLLILLAVALLTFFIFWQKRVQLKRKNELLRLELQHTEDKLDLEDAMNEMRLLALQARLNPHFVFNCLVVVQNLTLRGENDTALRYLKDFSRLTRMVFEISQKPSLSLEEEIDFLELYIDLENRRLRSQVTLKLDLDPAIDPDDVFIPPLLLQPIIENCFKHGFSDTREDQQITLAFRMEEDSLFCTISDNGKGIVGNTEHNRPSGIRITRKRLAIMAKKETAPERLTLTPNQNGPGTQAEMKIPMVSA